MTGLVRAIRPEHRYFGCWKRNTGGHDWLETARTSARSLTESRSIV
jgi:hypothetical protein